MSFITRLAWGDLAMKSAVRPWLVSVVCAGATAAFIGITQQPDAALARPPAPSALATVPDRFTAPPRTAFAPTFAEAATSLRAGRYPEAYGRFVALADEGDVAAGQIALLMHRFGPELFGSAWDANSEQLAAWTRWSDEAAQSELARVPTKTPGAGEGTLAHGQATSRERRNCASEVGRATRPQY